MFVLIKPSGNNDVSQLLTSTGIEINRQHITNFVQQLPSGTVSVHPSATSHQQMIHTATLSPLKQEGMTLTGSIQQQQQNSTSQNQNSSNTSHVSNKQLNKRQQQQQQNQQQHHQQPIQIQQQITGQPQLQLATAIAFPGNPMQTSHGQQQQMSSGQQINLLIPPVAPATSTHTQQTTTTSSRSSNDNI